MKSIKNTYRLSLQNIEKHFFLKVFLFSCVLFISCKLEIPIEDEVTGFDAVDTIAVAEEALADIYLAYPKDKLLFSKLADDFYPNHTVSDNTSSYDFYNWNKKEIQLWSNELWSSYYNTIAKANVLLQTISNITTRSAKEKQHLANIKAQTLALKALCFFELTQVYCKPYSESTKNDLGIVLKHSLVSVDLPRATLIASLKAVEKMLLEAELLFDDNQKTSHRFSKLGVKLLRAKLYLNWAKYKEAVSICNELIISSDLDETTLPKMCNGLQKSYKYDLIPEVFLAMESTVSYFNGIYSNNKNKDEYYLNTAIKYDKDDVRNENYVVKYNFRKTDGTLKEYCYLGKLRKRIDDAKAKSVPILRLAEVYFIKAESLYKLSDYSGAEGAVNTFLEKRNSEAIETGTTGLLVKILYQKQKEFVGEGLRYFDLKRNRLAVNRVDMKENKVTKSISESDYRWVFPIAENELRYNSKVKNNDSW